MSARSPLIAPLYLAAFLLVALPATDFVSNVWPLQPGDFRWRFGTVGLLSGFLLTPLLGLVLAAATAAAAQHRLAAGVIAGVNLAGAALLLGALAFFALDVVQLRVEVPADRRGVFDFANYRAALKHLLGALAFGWLGLAGLRHARAAAPAAAPARPVAPRTPILTDPGVSRV